MQTIGDLLGAADDRTGPALETPSRTHDYPDLRATVHRTGNLLRHQGVGEDATVAVLDRSHPNALFCLLGATLLGAATRFGPPEAVDDRVLFGPTPALESYETAARTRRIGYGSPPDDPAWVHFERDVWGENPAFPETAIDPDTTALVADRAYAHAELLEAAEDVVADAGLDDSDAVAIRAPLAAPGTVIAGVLAPLRAGATVLLPAEGTEDGGDGAESATAEGGDGGTVAVVEEHGADVPESTVVVAETATP